MAVIGTANLYVDRLSQQSEQLIEQGISLARQTKALEEKIVAMERNARQYQVLGDYPLVELTGKRQVELTGILDDLETSHKHQVSNWHLDQIREDSLAILDALITTAPQSPKLAKELERFERLRQLAEGIRVQSDRFVNKKSRQLQNTARDAGQLLWLMAITLIPVVVLISLVFTVLISRPMHQIEHAIRELGRGTLTQPVQVSGPRELEALGMRLDWLRHRLTTIEDQKNRFMRHMSHELKTPLASIREGSEQLMDGTGGSLSPVQQEIADILRNSSLELQFLIENLLDYEEWREKSAELIASEFPIRPLVQSVIDRYRLIVANKRISVHARSGNFDLCADRARTRLILDNLVSNAVKFAPVGGAVHIRARVDQRQDGTDEAVIEVADTGPGIPPEERAHVFDPFYQGQRAPGGHLRGSGIGLSVVRDCVDAHGGKIELVEGEYAGAHFRVSLPFASVSKNDQTH